MRNEDFFKDAADVSSEGFLSPISLLSPSRSYHSNKHECAYATNGAFRSSHMTVEPPENYSATWRLNCFARVDGRRNIIGKQSNSSMRGPKSSPLQRLFGTKASPSRQAGDMVKETAEGRGPIHSNSGLTR